MKQKHKLLNFFHHALRKLEGCFELEKYRISSNKSRDLYFQKKVFSAPLLEGGL